MRRLSAGPMPILSWPCRAVSARNLPIVSSKLRSIAAPSRWKRRPSLVSFNARVVRANSSVPRSSSRVLIARLTAAGSISRLRAAPTKLPLSTTRTKISIKRMLVRIIDLFSFLTCKIYFLSERGRRCRPCTPTTLEGAMLHRRRFLQGLGTASVMSVTTYPAWAEAYPSRPVRIIVGFAAGGNFDIVARVIAERMAERLGQPVLVENRPGAASNIATEAAIRAPADGYTLLFARAGNAINANVYDKLNFNFASDVAPIAGATQFPNVMTVNSSFPAKSVPEFIAYAKANPGKINHGSSGIGTSQHLAGELFKVAAGVSFTHIPYRGAPPALTDLLSGQVQGLFEALPPRSEERRVGKE